MSFREPYKLWGEIPGSSTNLELSKIPRTDVDRIKDLAFKENLSTPISEFKSSEPDTITVDSRCCAMEESVVHTIGLMKHLKILEAVVDKYKSGNPDLKQVENILLHPPIPKLDEKKLPKTKKKLKLKDEKGVSYFIQGRWSPNEKPPDIPSRQILMKLLYKSVLTILSFIGFDDVTGSAASVLTEVADEYFSKFLSTLRDNCDAYHTPSQNIGFVDPMEATYQQMGIGNILVISDFYQNVVKGQQIVVKKKIIKLYEELNDLHTSYLRSNPKKYTFISNMNSSETLNSIKNATQDCKEVPTIQLSDQEVGENYNVAAFAANSSILEKFESYERSQPTYQF